MKYWLKLLTICAVLGFALYSCAGFLVHTESYKWNQRLTVIVDTPAGEVRGSSVVEVGISQTRGAIVPVEATGKKPSLSGEAVVVEVLPGRWLFVVLHGRSPTGWVSPVMETMAFKTFEPLRSEEVLYRLPLAEAMAALDVIPPDVPSEVPMEVYPQMVTFDDMSRPESVRLVDPLNMSKTFGPGVSLKAFTLELTDSDVTTGQVKALLPWLRDIWPNMLDGDRYAYRNAVNQVANGLSANSFSTEVSHIDAE